MLQLLKLLLFAALLNTVLSHVYLSNIGNDINNCTLSHPCFTLFHAITSPLYSGHVVLLPGTFTESSFEDSLIDTDVELSALNTEAEPTILTCLNGPLFNLTHSNLILRNMVVENCTHAVVQASDSSVELSLVDFRNVNTFYLINLANSSLSLSNSTLFNSNSNFISFSNSTCFVNSLHIHNIFANSVFFNSINSNFEITNVSIKDSVFFSFLNSNRTVFNNDLLSGIINQLDSSIEFLSIHNSTFLNYFISSFNFNFNMAKIMAAADTFFLFEFFYSFNSSISISSISMSLLSNSFVYADNSNIVVTNSMLSSASESNSTITVTSSQVFITNCLFSNISGKILEVRDNSIVKLTNNSIQDSYSNYGAFDFVNSFALIQETCISNTKFSNIIDSKTSTITITDFDIVHHESNTGSFINADDSTLDFTNVKTLGPVDSDGKVISGCANDEPLITLVKSNVDFDDVVVVGCQSQSIVATDSTIDLETVLARDSTANDGHFELTNTNLTMNSANFQGLEGKVFNIKDNTKVTGTNVGISDSDSTTDSIILIDNSELTLATVDLSDTKFSNIIDSKTSTITITDFDIVHHESNTGSIINADDSTLDFTNVKTLGPVDSDGKVISGCANDEPLITLVKSNVDFDDVVVVGCQSQSIVATDSTIDLETVLVRDSTANDGHFELRNTNLTMNSANFQGLEGKVFNIKDNTKVTGTNVGISDSDSTTDSIILIDNSELTLATVDLSDTKFSNIIDSKTSTITITDFDIVHHESNTGSFINADDSTLDFTNVKTLGPVDSDGKVISGCANDEPLITLVKSNVDFDDVVVVGCQSQSIVATDSTIDLETVLVRDSTANDGHFELTNTNLTMNSANFQGLEGKVFNIKDNTKVTGTNVGISDSDSTTDSIILIDNSELTLATVDLSDTKFSNIIDSKTSTITITDFDIVHHESNTGSFINADDSTLDFTNVKTLGPVDSDGKVISGCANDEPLITLVKSNVDFDDVVVVGCQSQSIVATDSTIDLETVLVRDSTANDGHFELTNTNLTMNSANFQGLEGKVFNIKDNTKVTGTNVGISDSDSTTDSIILIDNSELTLATVDLSDTKFSNIIDSKTSTITITDFDIVHHESNTGSIINADDSTLDFTNVKTLGPVDSDGKVISGCANDEPLITLVKSNVDFDDVVVVGCQSQSIVATDSTIDLETVLVRDSTANDGHFELTNTNLTMNSANFQGLEGKVFNIKDNTKVTGTNVGISDSDSTTDSIILIDNSELTLATVDLSDTKFSNIIDSKTSTITITDFDIVHHESNTGSFINADDSTLDFTNVKTLGPVDSDGKVISGCANDEPLITLVKSNVDFDDVVVVGCQSQSIVATDSTIDLETVLVRDSTANDGHFELTNTNLTMNSANFQGLEGKVFNIKDNTKVTGTNVGISDSDSTTDSIILIDNSELTLATVDLSDTKFSNIIDSKTSTITITDFDIVHHESNTGSIINADDSTLDFTNVKTLGPVDSDGKVISGCANDEPLITLVKSNVDFDDVVVVGCQSQSIVATDSTIDLETVLVRDSTANDGHFELTNTNLTMNSANFQGLEGKVFNIKDNTKVTGTNVGISDSDSTTDSIILIDNSELTLATVDLSDTKFSNIIDSKTSTITITDFDIVHHESNTGPVDSDGKVISGCANDEPLITLVKSNVDFDDVVVVGCQSQSIVATDSTIDLETVLVRDSTANDGHFELTNTNLTMNSANFQGLEGKVFNIKDNTKVTGTNVGISDSDSTTDSIILIDNSELTLATVDLSDTKFSNIIDSKTSTITITDFDIVHHESNTGSFINADDSTLDFTNVKTLGPVDSDGKVISGCANDEPLITLVKSNVDFDDVVVVGCQSQSIVATDSTIDLETVLVRDSTANDGHFELTNTNFTMNSANFQGLEGKVFNIKDNTKVTGTNVGISDSDSTTDSIILIDNSELTLATVDLSDTKFSNIIDSKTSTITITDFDIVHHESNTGSFINADDSTLDFTNVKTLGPVDSDGKVISGCANDEPLITLVKSNVDFDDVVVVGCQSQSIVATDSTIDLETVLVRDSTANDGHFELTNTNFTMNSANFQGLEGKVFNIKDNTKVTGTNVGISDSDSTTDSIILIDNSELTLATVDLSDTKFSNIIDSKTSTITITDFDIVHHESNTGSFINADDSTLDFTNVKTLGPVDSDGKVISGCANDEPLITLVKSNVDFDDVVVVGCQSQSIVATDSTIDLETVLVRDSTANDGHFELTNTNLTMNSANFQGLEGKVFNIKDNTKVTGTNVGISDSDSTTDSIILIDNSELTLATVDLSDTKFSNIIDSKTSTITITDFDIVHHESNTGSFINADDSTLDFTNVKTLGPVDSDGKVISGCANDEPLITLVKSNVDFDDVVVVGCQSQSIVATDSTIDLETVLVRDSTANDGHFELTNTNLTMNSANFQGLEGKVFNIKDNTKVTGTNVGISDSDSTTDSIILIDNSELTLATVDLSDTKFSNIIDSKTSTITITDFDIVHHESNTGSFINADDSTLDFTNVKTLGPVDSDGKVISGCANDEPLITLVKSNVDFDDVVVVGCQSQSIVATDSTIDLETVLVRDSTANDGHFELTNTNLTMNSANFQGLEGKVFNIKDNTKVTGTNVGISDSDLTTDSIILIDNSELTLATVDLSDTKFSNIIDSKTSTITITDFDIVHHESNTGSFINADDSTLDFTNVKTLGPVDSDGKVISGCANDEPLITLVKSNVDFDDVVVVGCQSQSIVATDSTIDLETVLVRDSTANDGHFELTNTNLTMNSANFQGLEGKVFNIQDNTKVTGTNVGISDSDSTTDSIILIDNSELTLATVDLSDTKFSNIIDSKTSTITITDFDIVHHESNTGSFINADDSTLDFTNVKTLGPVDSDGKVISGCANDEPLITLVESNVDFDDVVVVGCQSQSIVATDSTIDLETVLVRDSTAHDGHFELTNTNLTMNNANFQGLEGKVFNIKDNTKVTGTNVGISDSDSTTDSIILIDNSELTLATVDLSDTKFSNIIDSKTSTIIITDFDIVHHESNTGSIINADDSTLDFTNVKTLGPVDSDGKVISGCANDEPLITLVKSNVDFDDVVVVGCQSQSIVATDSTIDLESALVRDSAAHDGHIELTNTNLTMNYANFQGLEGKVFNIKDNTKVTGTNVSISDSDSTTDSIILINNSELTFATVDLSDTKFSNIIDSKTSTITITDLYIVHHESNTGSFINGDDSTLDFTNVKTLGPVDSDGKVISGCANDEPLITLVKSNVDFDNVVVAGCQSQSIVATDSTIDLESVLVRDSTAHDGQIELTNTNLTMNNANFQGLEGKVFDVKSDSKVEGLNVKVIDTTTDNDPMMVTDSSTVDFKQIEIINSCVRPAFESIDSTIKIDDFKVSHPNTYSGSLFDVSSASELTLDNINIVKESTTSTTVTCSFTDPLFTVDNSEVTLADSSLIGYLSQTLVGINNADVTFTNVDVLDSQASGHVALTNSHLGFFNCTLSILNGTVFKAISSKLNIVSVDVDRFSTTNSFLVSNDSILLFENFHLSHSTPQNLFDISNSVFTGVALDIEISTSFETTLFQITTSEFLITFSTFNQLTTNELSGLVSFNSNIYFINSIIRLFSFNIINSTVAMNSSEMMVVDGSPLVDNSKLYFYNKSILNISYFDGLITDSFMEIMGDSVVSLSQANKCLASNLTLVLVDQSVFEATSGLCELSFDLITLNDSSIFNSSCIGYVFVTDFYQYSGHSTGASDVIITNSLFWNGGQLSSTTPAHIASTFITHRALITSSLSQHLSISHRNLVISGTCHLNTNELELLYGAAVVIQALGTLVANQTDLLLHNNNNGSVVNHGIMVFPGFNTVTFNVKLHNYGRILLCKTIIITSNFENFGYVESLHGCGESEVRLEGGNALLDGDFDHYAGLLIVEGASVTITTPLRNELLILYGYLLVKSSATIDRLTIDLDCSLDCLDPPVVLENGSMIHLLDFSRGKVELHHDVLISTADIASESQFVIALNNTPMVSPGIFTYHGSIVGEGILLLDNGYCDQFGCYCFEGDSCHLTCAEVPSCSLCVSYPNCGWAFDESLCDAANDNGFPTFRRYHNWYYGSCETCLLIDDPLPHVRIDSFQADQSTHFFSVVVPYVRNGLFWQILFLKDEVSSNQCARRVPDFPSYIMSFSAPHANLSTSINNFYYPTYFDDLFWEQQAVSCGVVSYTNFVSLQHLLQCLYDKFYLYSQSPLILFDGLLGVNLIDTLGGGHVDLGGFKRPFSINSIAVITNITSTGSHIMESDLKYLFIAFNVVDLFYEMTIQFSSHFQFDKVLAEGNVDFKSHDSQYTISNQAESLQDLLGTYTLTNFFGGFLVNIVVELVELPSLFNLDNSTACYLMTNSQDLTTFFPSFSGISGLHEPCCFDSGEFGYLYFFGMRHLIVESLHLCPLNLFGVFDVHQLSCLNSLLANTILIQPKDLDCNEVVCMVPFPLPQVTTRSLYLVDVYYQHSASLDQSVLAIVVFPTVEQPSYWRYISLILMSLILTFLLFLERKRLLFLVSIGLGRRRQKQHLKKVHKLSPLKTVISHNSKADLHVEKAFYSLSNSLPTPLVLRSKPQHRGSRYAVPGFVD
ncbi:hypothetical protein P9112_000160 [Eukaryota sp. TZLM1-RC]